MIRERRRGQYKLIETKSQNKILYLDNDTYAWVEPPTLGELLVVSRREHTTDCILSMGSYSLFEVEDEPDLADTTHLELEVGNGVWQGYLLLTGLPDRHKTRARIIPTKEYITNNPAFTERGDVTQVLAKER